MPRWPEDRLIDAEVVPLASEWRRCGLYFVVGTLVAGGVCVELDRGGLKPFGIGGIFWLAVFVLTLGDLARVASAPKAQSFVVSRENNPNQSTSRPSNRLFRQ
jgi:hypothetical protein